MLLKTAIFACLALSLGACTSLTPAGLVAASRLDPLPTPPAAIAVAVGVPETVKLTDGDAEFALSFVPEDTRHATVSETVSLQVRPSTDGRPEPNSATETVYIAGFSETDAQRVAAAQAKIKAMKNSGVDGEGTLSIGVVGGCTKAPLVSLPLSTWLRTDPDRAFVRLTRTQDMLVTLPAEEAAAFRAGFKPCD